MTPVRAPDVVRGDVPGLLCRAMPVVLHIRIGDDDGVTQVRGVLHHVEPADDGDGADTVGYYQDARIGRGRYYGASLTIDWSDRAAIYLCLAWLADRGHPGCLWMLPTTHGGNVSAHAGLTAWEVSAILVARSVARVARGLGPVRDLLGPSVAWTASKTLRSGRRVDLGHGGYKRKSIATMTVTHTDDRRWFYGGGNVVSQSGERDWKSYPSADSVTTWEAHARDVTDRTALADGCALLDPSGILLPD